MEYRGIEYKIIQGIERGIWKWSLSLGEPKMIKVGQAKNKQDAVAEVERAIDRALARKKLRIALPGPSDGQTRGLIRVGEHGGDPMMAHIAMMRALQRHKPKAAPAPRRKRAKVHRIIR